MIIEKAFAKVNLGLEVCGKRTDGFHDLKMIILPISLYDTLYFEIDDDITLEVKGADISLKDNLVYQVTCYKKDYFDIKKGVKITLDKQIPLGAGLGGGSSDAAATIRALSKLWNLHLSDAKMHEISLLFGSDVPFFIKSLPSLVEGRGEILKPIKLKKALEMILLYPNYQTKTKEVFSKISTYQSSKRIDYLKMALEEGNIKKIANLVFNDLSEASNIVCQNNNNISPNFLLELLKKYFPLATLMSGSGSTIISLWEDASYKNSLFEYLKALYPEYSFYNVVANCH